MPKHNLDEIARLVLDIARDNARETEGVTCNKNVGIDDTLPGVEAQFQSALSLIQSLMGKDFRDYHHLDSPISGSEARELEARFSAYFVPAILESRVWGWAQAGEPPILLGRSFTATDTARLSDLPIGKKIRISLKDGRTDEHVVVRRVGSTHYDVHHVRGDTMETPTKARSFGGAIAAIQSRMKEIRRRSDATRPWRRPY